MPPLNLNLVTKIFNLAASEEKIRRWIQRVNHLATSPQSKSEVSQLTTVINYLNRKPTEESAVLNYNNC
jgi:UDP-galactopyranose mutase